MLLRILLSELLEVWGPIKQVQSCHIFCAFITGLFQPDVFLISFLAHFWQNSVCKYFVDFCLLLKNIIHRCYFKKDPTLSRYRYVVLGRDSSYFVKTIPNHLRYIPKIKVFKMLESFVDNMFVQCGGRVFQQTVGIPMETNCAPQLADLFLHS